MKKQKQKQKTPVSRPQNGKEFLTIRKRTDIHAPERAGRGVGGGMTKEPGSLELYPNPRRKSCPRPGLRPRMGAGGRARGSTRRERAHPGWGGAHGADGRGQLGGIACGRGSLCVCV